MTGYESVMLLSAVVTAIVAAVSLVLEILKALNEKEDKGD